MAPPHTEPIPEIDILWITAGLSCDGDTISMTAATQPSIEDIVLGGLPGIPKVNLHNPFLAREVGDEFLKPFHLAAEGQASPFILVIEGSIPNENNKSEGYWASLGTDEKTGQPTSVNIMATLMAGLSYICLNCFVLAAPSDPPSAGSLQTPSRAPPCGQYISR
jgi:Ni,Fe-hydrogenase I small subunit